MLPYEIITQIISYLPFSSLNTLWLSDSCYASNVRDWIVQMSVNSMKNIHNLQNLFNLMCQLDQFKLGTLWRQRFVGMERLYLLETLMAVFLDFGDTVELLNAYHVLLEALELSDSEKSMFQRLVQVDTFPEPVNDNWIEPTIASILNHDWFWPWNPLAVSVVKDSWSNLGHLEQETAIRILYNSTRIWGYQGTPENRFDDLVAVTSRLGQLLTLIGIFKPVNIDSSVGLLQKCSKFEIRSWFCGLNRSNVLQDGLDFLVYAYSSMEDELELVQFFGEINLSNFQKMVALKYHVVGDGKLDMEHLDTVFRLILQVLGPDKLTYVEIGMLLSPSMDIYAEECGWDDVDCSCEALFAAIELLDFPVDEAVVEIFIHEYSSGVNSLFSKVLIHFCHTWAQACAFMEEIFRFDDFRELEPKLDEDVEEFFRDIRQSFAQVYGPENDGI